MRHCVLAAGFYGTYDPEHFPSYEALAVGPHPTDPGGCRLDRAGKKGDTSTYQCSTISPSIIKLQA